MKITINPKTTDQITSGPVLQQTSFWAKVKSRHGQASLAFTVDSEINDSDRSEKEQKDLVPIDGAGYDDARDLLVVLQKPARDAAIAYIPYGPKFRPPEEERGLCLEELSEGLREFLPRECMMIRYDLVWDSPWVDDENRYDGSGRWMGPPDPRIREMRMNFDTRERRLRKAPTDILPSHTVFIDLTKDEPELLRRMKPKTRYNIRLSISKGVRVRQASPAELPLWYDLYRQTALRNRIHLDGPGYFESVLRTGTETGKSKTNVRLLVSEAEGVPLAGMFLVISGGRATYLYGASSDANRNMMGAYALQWEAMRLSKSLGCTNYDLFGISQDPDPSHPMWGLYRFKTGFGGKIRHRQGCWDYPLHEDRYENFRAAELAAPGYHLRRSQATKPVRF